MPKADRADLILTTEAEAGRFVQAAGCAMSQCKIIHFPAVPAGACRDLLGDRAVGRATVERIDMAIRLLKP